MRKLVLAVVLGILVAWTWTTDDGVESWTDDEERIPARYADEAERVEIGTLEEYRKFTGAVRRLTDGAQGRDGEVDGR